MGMPIESFANTTSAKRCLPSRHLPPVSRYGGILLGPARFTHINNAARELLDACGYIAAKDGGGKGSGSGKGKKR